MTEINCAWCKKPIDVSPYRLKSGAKISCSYRCGARVRTASGAYDGMAIDAQKLAAIEHAYTSTPKTLESIAADLGVSRSTITGYAKTRHWKKFQRTTRNRTLYRNAATKKIGRKLQHGEHVHHIDGLQNNNKETNLHVFPDAKAHSECHASLENAAFALFRRGLITFSEKHGRYSVSKTAPLSSSGPSNESLVGRK